MSPTGLIVFAIIFVPMFLIGMRQVRSQAQLQVDWRTRLAGTTWGDRRRIVAAVRRGERLDLPREAGAAVLMAERQIAWYRSRRWTPRVIAGLGLAFCLLGPFAGAWTVSALGAIFIAFGVLDIVHSKRLMDRLEVAARRNREQASLQ